MTRFTWCNDAAEAESLAAFFAENVTLSYISHSELQFGRAEAPDQWSPRLCAILESEIEQRVPTKLGSSFRVASAYDGAELVGVAYVTFNMDVPIPFLIVEDIVITASKRGAGIGQSFLTWIFARGKEEGVKRAFLESGKDNQNAHHFFERNNFKQVSIVMMADLDDC